MYPTVKQPSVMCLVLHDIIKRAYTLSPFVHLTEIVNEKRMNTLFKPLNELYDAQLALFATFTEFRYCYTFGSGCTTNHYLAGLYGAWAKRAKEFSALLKKHAAQPEIVEYYQIMQTFLKRDVYAMMKHDFIESAHAFSNRRLVDEAKYPEWTLWEPLEVDWEVINKRFKDAK